MKYLIWYNNDHKKDKDRLLNVLLTNHSFAEIFEGDNPLHPVGGTIMMNDKKYQITKFQKMEDMIEVKVVLVTGEVSEAA